MFDQVRSSLGKPAAVFVTAALAVAGCGGSSSESASTPAPAEVTTTVPSAPVVQAISGNQVDFGDALTQDTVLWFWAPW